MIQYVSDYQDLRLFIHYTVLTVLQKSEGAKLFTLYGLCTILPNLFVSPKLNMRLVLQEHSSRALAINYNEP